MLCSGAQSYIEETVLILGSDDEVTFSCQRATVSPVWQETHNLTQLIRQHHLHRCQYSPARLKRSGVFHKSHTFTHKLNCDHFLSERRVKRVKLSAGAPRRQSDRDSFLSGLWWSVSLWSGAGAKHSLTRTHKERFLGEGEQGQAGELDWCDITGMAPGLEVCLWEWREAAETNTLKEAFLLQRRLITGLHTHTKPQPRVRAHIFQCPLPSLLTLLALSRAHSPHVDVQRLCVCQKPWGTWLRPFMKKRRWADWNKVGWMWQWKSQQGRNANAR